VREWESSGHGRSRISGRHGRKTRCSGWKRNHNGSAADIDSWGASFPEWMTEMSPGIELIACPVLQGDAPVFQMCEKFPTLSPEASRMAGGGRGKTASGVRGGRLTVTASHGRLVHHAGGRHAHRGLLPQPVAVGGRIAPSPQCLTPMLTLSGSLCVFLALEPCDIHRSFDCCAERLPSF